MRNILEGGWTDSITPTEDKPVGWAVPTTLIQAEQAFCLLHMCAARSQFNHDRILQHRARVVEYDRDLHRRNVNIYSLL